MANSDDIYFARTEKTICWKDDLGYALWRGLAIPTEEVKEMDGAPDGVNFCLVRLFDEDRPKRAYVKVEITGRKPTNVLGRASYGEEQGMRAKITFTEFDFETGEHVYTDSVTAWVVD